MKGSGGWKILDDEAYLLNHDCPVRRKHKLPWRIDFPGLGIGIRIHGDDMYVWSEWHDRMEEWWRRRRLDFHLSRARVNNCIYSFILHTSSTFFSFSLLLFFFFFFLFLPSSSFKTRLIDGFDLVSNL